MWSLLYDLGFLTNHITRNKFTYSTTHIQCNLVWFTSGVGAVGQDRKMTIKLGDPSSSLCTILCWSRVTFQPSQSVKLALI